jgi:hypothetical protein
MYRDDYAKAGIPLLPVIEPDGRRTGQQALLYATALWPVSIMPAVVGLADWPYSVVATVLGIGLIGLSGAFARQRSLETARGYGSSEMQLGWILPRLPREKMIVQTKVAPSEAPKTSVNLLRVGLTLLLVCCVGFVAVRRGKELEVPLNQAGFVQCARLEDGLAETVLHRHMEPGPA